MKDVYTKAEVAELFPLARSSPGEDGQQTVLFDGKTKQVLVELKDGDVSYLWWKDKTTGEYDGIWELLK